VKKKKVNAENLSGEKEKSYNKKFLKMKK